MRRIATDITPMNNSAIGHAFLLPLLLLLVSSVCTTAFQRPPTNSFPVRSRQVVDPNSHLASTKLNNDLIVENDDPRRNHDEKQPTGAMARRGFFTKSIASSSAAALATSSVFFPFNSVANSVEPSSTLQPYEDSDFGFSLLVPSTWERSEQKLSGRRKAIFLTDKPNNGNNIDTLLIIAYTPLRDDFTSLSSFGSVDEVAQTTILPKGELAADVGKDNLNSKMLETVSKNNAYYFDYVTTPVVPNDTSESSSDTGGAIPLTKELKPQHFRTIFTMLPLKGAAGLTLVTINMQTTEEKYSMDGDLKLKRMFDEIIGSYKK